MNQHIQVTSMDIDEAADFLIIHPVTLSTRAALGEIPGAKIGKSWVFLNIDLIEYIRSQYKSRALQGEEKEILCHSTNAQIRQLGGLKSPSLDEKYNDLLGLKTKSKLRNSTIS